MSALIPCHRVIRSKAGRAVCFKCRPVPIF
ncbi:hypothetical protein [Sphingorhabdus sp.]